MFGEFNEAAQPKTSLAKYSIEFKLGRPYTLLYVGRSVGRLSCNLPIHTIDFTNP